MASNPEMPCYRSHKTVRAFQILNITPVAGRPNSRFLVPTNNCYGKEVDGAYMRKHQPSVGGYFVLYKDGYQSFSPAQAFEDGYTLCTDDCEGSDPKEPAEPDPKEDSDIGEVEWSRP